MIYYRLSQRAAREQTFARGVARRCSPLVIEKGCQFRNFRRNGNIDCQEIMDEISKEKIGFNLTFLEGQCWLLSKERVAALIAIRNKMANDNSLFNSKPDYS